MVKKTLYFLFISFERGFIKPLLLQSGVYGRNTKESSSLRIIDDEEKDIRCNEKRIGS
jgi:hypothetical protein